VGGGGEEAASLSLFGLNEITGIGGLVAGKECLMQKSTQESATSWKPRVAVMPDCLHIVRGSWGVTQEWPEWKRQ